MRGATFRRIGMMMSLQLITLLLLAAAGSAPEAPAAIDADITTIRTMSVVSDGHDGDAGITPESVLAFRRLVKAEGASRLFAKLLSKATPSGQMYALCGLFFTDPEAFKSALLTFENSKQTVPHQQGCISSTDTVADMIHSRYRPVMRLEPGESTDRWFREHPGKRDAGFHVDIAGGGFCQLVNGTLWPEKVPSSRRSQRKNS